MNKEYLLTFRWVEGSFTFEWFDTEDELRDRIKELEGRTVDIEAIRVNVVEKII